MFRWNRLAAAILVACVTLPVSAAAQSQAIAQPAVWRGFAEKMDVGTDLVVRLHNGQRFRAAIVAVREDAVLLQPKTRVAVPAQAVPYEAILSMERAGQGGIGAGKAAAIGVAAGAGTFLAIMLILVASLD